jgi:type IV pilus assembly protein PilQ
MRSSAKKYWLLKFLTLVTIVCIICPAAIAGDANDANKPPERAPFEQRMQKRVSLDFRNTPIEDVIRIMAEQADVDIVKSPAVTGPVTVTLTNVPLEEALNQILAAHGYAYVLSQNMIRVITAVEKTEKPELMQTKTFEIVYADVKEVVKALDKFKSKEGMVSSIDGTSHIIVADTESKIRDITLLIDKIDRVTPQVLIEVRIYDITSKDKLDLGVRWNVGRASDGSFTTVGTNPTSGPRNPFLTSGFNNPTNSTGTDVTGALRFGWLNKSIDIDVLLTAQEEITQAKLLANPRILVLDNQKATFDIVTEHPYIERTLSSGTTTETVAFKEVGVKLEVTPKITRDGMIRLHILPEFGVLVERVQLSSSDVPVVDTRKVDTIALIQDGQTVVLGGMRKKDEHKAVNKIPVLGDIPVLGGLFRFKGDDTAVTELIVFITPRIITQPVLSSAEQKAYEITEFKGPEPTMTKAEKPEKAKE